MKLVDTPLEDVPAGRSGVRDYERVARAIEFLRRNAVSQPDLAAVARHLHLSEHHFQRLFTRWAGVSPKRFVQYLTVEHAKSRLVPFQLSEGNPVSSTCPDYRRQSSPVPTIGDNPAAPPEPTSWNGASRPGLEKQVGTALAATSGVLDASGAVGLSGPGRLHDLFVTLEAMSPGEYKAGGAGLSIRYGVHESPFGAALVAVTARGICGLHFVGGAGAGIERLRRDWPGAELRQDPGGTAPVCERLFRPLASQPGRPLALLVKGSNFQVKVWRALLELPFGSLASYGHVAGRIGAPGSARAVGTAIGANPIAWLIPCHRVIRESGALGGYRWGAERKTAMLGWEAAHMARTAAQA